MEEKELKPKKKGTPKKKETDTIVENPVEETQVEETLKEEAPTVVETPANEKPIEEAPEAKKPIEETPKTEKPVVEAKKQPSTDTPRMPVPTIAELRNMRGFNESVFTFTDGFACTATSQHVANRKHDAWLKGE